MKYSIRLNLLLLSLTALIAQGCAPSDSAEATSSDKVAPVAVFGVVLTKEAIGLAAIATVGLYTIIEGTRDSNGHITYDAPVPDGTTAYPSVAAAREVAEELTVAADLLNDFTDELGLFKGRDAVYDLRRLRSVGLLGGADGTYGEIVVPNIPGYYRCQAIMAILATKPTPKPCKVTGLKDLGTTSVSNLLVRRLSKDSTSERSLDGACFCVPPEYRTIEQHETMGSR